MNRALTPQDEAILRLEGALLAGHTCKVIVLGEGGPSFGQLRDRIAGRVDEVPALRTRLAGEAGGMAWVPAEDFDLSAHVVEVATQPIEPEAIPREVGRLFSERLDRRRPLWRIDVLPLADEGCAVVWRLHHTLADGTTAMRYARTLLWDAQAAGSSQSGHAPHGPAVADRDEHRRRTHVARFFTREFARAPSPFDGSISARREVAFARLPLSPLHRAAKLLAGATVNDAVVSAIGGGVRSWLERHHGHTGRVRVKIPVSLHSPEDDLGNADSFFIVGVPLEHDDPVQRLRAVRAATAKRKAEHDAETMDRLLRDLRTVSPRLASFCERVERSGRAFALNVSNVPGPREQVAICGARVQSLYSLAEIARHHAVRIAAVSLCDELFLGFCAEPAIVEDVASLARATEAEGVELIAAAPA